MTDKLIRKTNSTTGEYREAVLKDDGRWHLTAGKGKPAHEIRIIFDVYYYPKQTREEAQAWVDEVSTVRTPNWLSQPSGLVVLSGSDK